MTLISFAYTIFFSHKQSSSVLMTAILTCTKEKSYSIFSPNVLDLKHREVYASKTDCFLFTNLACTLLSGKKL